MKTMVTIYADEGKVLTNGEVYGTTISLAEGETAEDFYEITKAEHNEILQKEAEQHNHEIV